MTDEEKEKFKLAVDALKKYGEHLKVCDTHVGWNPRDRECDCGLDLVVKVLSKSDLS